MPQILVLAGPSGCGKNSVERCLIDKAGFSKLKTCTTRDIREKEVDGVDYDFLDIDEFSALKDSGQLLDHVVISGKHYGIPFSNLNNAISNNQRVVINVAVGSAFLLKQFVPDAVLVFILPPSEKEQINRLSGRGMTEAQIKERLRDDPTPISSCRYFDLVVVNHNDDLEGATMKILEFLSSSSFVQNDSIDLNLNNMSKNTNQPKYLCTGNKNKIKEFNQILPDSLQLEQINIDLPEPQGVAVEEVIAEKAKAAFQKTGKSVLVEDSGLEFLAWNNLPGALVKWFMDTVGVDGIIEMLSQYRDRSAVAKTCIGYYDGNEVKIFTGKINGSIVEQPRGNDGFGWDPLFVPDGQDKTYAEMTSEEKNANSMRALAIQELINYFV